MRWLLRSKIHKATVTESNIDYVGSITIDENLIDKADFMPGEKVLVVDNTNGARIETYIMAGARGSGVICMNGASAHLIKTGDEIVIMGFSLSNKLIDTTSILVDQNNAFVRYL